MQPLTTTLLWFAAVGCGLMAGVYFAFSAFIMAALREIPGAAGVAAMQSINRVILRSLFLPLFFATTIAAAVLAVMAMLQWHAPGSLPMLLGGLSYVVTMFFCTMAFNVPLNNRLAGLDPASGSTQTSWAVYLREWTRWNHVRTIGSAGASAAFICAIVARAT